MLIRHLGYADQASWVCWSQDMQVTTEESVLATLSSKPHVMHDASLA